MPAYLLFKGNELAPVPFETGGSQERFLIVLARGRQACRQGKALVWEIFS